MEAHILPALGTKDAAALGADDIRKWQQALVKAPKRHGGKRIEIDPSDPDQVRRRKATANRILATLKAALNKAVEMDKLSGSAEAWRRVKPFAKVNAPRIRFLSVDECTRLLNACDPDFRPLARAALLTGCRYGELTRMRAADFNRDMAHITVAESKSGNPRHVPLTDEGRRHFDAMTAGKGGAELIFTHADGSPWGRSHQTRPMQDASTAAQISPLVGFHDLRNTYGALLAMRGVSLLVIAELLGHSDTRITQRHYAHLSPSYVADTLRANLPEFGGTVDNGNVTRLHAGSGKI